MQRLEPLPFVAELAGEASKVGLLRWAASVDKPVLDFTVCSQASSAREVNSGLMLRAHRLWQATELPNAFQYPRDVLTTDAVIYSDVDAFALKSSAIIRHLMRRPLADAWPTLSAPTQRQLAQAVARLLQRILDAETGPVDRAE